MEYELKALRKEVAELRAEMARLRQAQVVHYHHHGPQTNSLLPPQQIGPAHRGYGSLQGVAEFSGNGRQANDGAWKRA